MIEYAVCLKGFFGWIPPNTMNMCHFWLVPLHHPEFGLGRIHPNILVVCSRFEGEKDCPPHKTYRFSKESCLLRGRRMANPCQSSLEALGGLTSLQWWREIEANVYRLSLDITLQLIQWSFGRGSQIDHPSTWMLYFSSRKEANQKSCRKSILISPKSVTRRPSSPPPKTELLHRHGCT